MDKSHAYKTWEEWFEAIDQYSETLKIRSRQRFEETEGIRLLTMHGAKGLEYDLVYIPDANQGIAPHKKALTCLLYTSGTVFTRQLMETAGFIRISAFRMTAAAIRCRERLCRNMRKQCLPETARFLKFHRPSAVLNTLWTRTAI